MTHSYILNDTVTFDEQLEHEFKGFEKIPSNLTKTRIRDFASKYINAFLNGEGGTIYLGIENDGRVTGVFLTREDRDDVQKRISQIIGQFYPPVEPNLYRIDFVPIYVEDQKRHRDDMYVIEIQVKKGLEDIYWPHKDKPESYIKLHADVISMPPPMIVQRVRSGRQFLPHSPTIPKSSESTIGYLPHDKQLVKVSRPTIDFTCHLPLAFGKGHGEIKLKSDLARNLRIQLTHKDLLGKLMIGLGTPLSKMLRPYLHQIDNDMFEVKLGQITIHLSQDEVVDLCECIDEVCQTYKIIVMNAEDALQTWEFTPIEYEGVYGFSLMRVRAELWALMHDFSHQFDYANGKSEWHIFHKINRAIRIGRGNDNHAFIHPIPSIDFYPPKTSTSSIELIYEVNDLHLSWEEDKKNKKKWHLSVGENGVWSANHTKEWIKNEFIPAVLHFYNKQIPKKLLKEIIEIDDWQYKHIPFTKIYKPQDLSLYIGDIQVWFLSPSRKISANLILPYYEALIELIKYASSSDVNMGYISGKLYGSVDCDFQTRDNYRNYHSIQEIIKYLTLHIQKVTRVGFDKSSAADDISRVFVTIIEEGKFHRFGQVELNQAKSVVAKLWRESRFERYHVFPNL